MTANRTSTAKAAFSRTSRVLRNTLQDGTKFTRRVAGVVIPKAFVWFREHLLSIAVLLMFPLAIAGYYWSNATSEEAQPPEYLSLDHPHQLAPIEESLREEAPLAAVTPETPMSLDAPPVLSFPSDSHGAELFIPQPLPIEAGETERLSQTEHTNPIDRILPGVTDPRIVDASANCVWLTGTIEEMESSSESWQYTSRVHELVVPRRN